MIKKFISIMWILLLSVSCEEEVTLEAETDSFSLFAVAEVEDVETESGATDGGETADGGETTDSQEDDGSGSPVVIGLLVVVILAVVAAIGYRQMNG